MVAVRRRPGVPCLNFHIQQVEFIRSLTRTCRTITYDHMTAKEPLSGQLYAKRAGETTVKSAAAELAAFRTLSRTNKDLAAYPASLPKALWETKRRGYK